jgi:hypothetical protein
VNTARLAVVLRGIGYAIASLPWVLGQAANGQPTPLTAAAETGLLVWLTGATLEFAVLFAWHRILMEVGGPATARCVSRFAAASGVAALIFSCGLVLLRVMIDTTLARTGSPLRTPDGRVNLEGLPSEIWPIVGSFLVVALAIGFLLSWQYVRVLLVLRSALMGSTGR